MNHWRLALYWLSVTTARAIEPMVAASSVDALATHYKRSIAQRARWMLAEHLKETKA